jgi:glycosyltransferase involved in cell wall biosynthesis
MLDIIIPAYEAHSTIEKTILSICSQFETSKIKVTIVDDYSPSGDYKLIVEKYKNLIDIQEIKMPENGGPGLARQFGIDKTNNPYIMFIDADDILANSLATFHLIKKLNENPNVVLVSVSFLEENENKELYPHENDLVWTFGKIYRRSYLQKNNIKFSHLRSNEDLEFNAKIRMCLKEKEQIEFVPNEYIYIWQFKKDSITRKNDAEYSYHHGLIGAFDAKIAALSFPGVDANKFKADIAAILFESYNQFNSIIFDRPQHKHDWLPAVFSKMVEFWKAFGKKEYTKMSDIDKALLFNKRDVSRVQHFIPNITIWEFFDMLDAGKINYEKINS